MSEEYQDGIQIIATKDTTDRHREAIEQLQQACDDLNERLTTVEQAKGIPERAVKEVLDRCADIEVKMVNLANKLDEHLKERDAHNPAMMHKK